MQRLLRPAPTQVASFVEYSQSRPGIPRAWLRVAYVIALVLAHAGVRPTTVTLAGALASAAVPFVAPSAAPVAAGLVLLTALADTVDGAVATIGGRASRLGQVYDALADRVAEACWLATLWRLGAPGWLPVVGWTACWLHEYTRARATTAGMPRAGYPTVADRPTRVIVVVLGLAIAGLFAPLSADLVRGTAAATCTIFVLLAVTGLFQLFAAVRRALR